MLVLNESQETVIVSKLVIFIQNLVYISWTLYTFRSLNRVRELLLKLIITQSKKAADISQTLKFQSSMFGLLISVLKVRDLTEANTVLG